MKPTSSSWKPESERRVLVNFGETSWLLRGLLTLLAAAVRLQSFLDSSSKDEWETQASSMLRLKMALEAETSGGSSFQ